MSETPRVYSASGTRFQLARRERRRRLFRILLLGIFAALLSFYWISRDTHPVATFVPADHALQVVAPRVMMTRHRVADSGVWQGVPRTWLPVDIPEVLHSRYDMPEWVLSNLAGGGVIVTANDTREWSDFVLVSRMTRVGCALERALRFSPANSRDWAGGLRLRFWEPAGLYYAVRGRSLLMSPSRDAIIASLTLEKSDRAAAESVAKALDQTGAEDFLGTWHPGASSQAGRVVDEIRFAVRVEASEAYLKLRARFRPELARDLAPYWRSAAPEKLAGPIPGPLAVSANFGTDLETTWAALSELFDVDWLSREQWEAWRNEKEGRSAAAVLTGLLGPMGPDIQATWYGMDLNEMAPTPILAGRIAADRTEAEAYLESIPSPDDVDAAQARVLYDDAEGEVRAPLMSGPSMTPVARWLDGGLSFCTSSVLADRYFTEDAVRGIALDRPGNLYVRARPLECTQLVVRAGRDLVQEGLIEGYTPDAYERASAQWLETAGALDFVEGLALVNHEGVEADIHLKCAKTP